MSFLGFRNAVSIGVSQHLTMGGPNLLNKLSPSLLLTFAGAETLDPRITFTRASTATFTGQNGLVQSAAINAPRFDYNPTTLAPLGLLIEEQRTNLLTYSEDFSNAFWFKNNWSALSNAAVAPDGNLTADKMVENTANGFHGTYTSSSQGTLTGAHTFSVYLKQAGRSWAIVRFNGVSTWFDIANGVTGTVGSGITASTTPVGNGWFRCSVTATISAAPVFCEVIMATSNNGTTYTGDGVSGIFIWGAQFEVGAFFTSYIPTVASQVTRLADNASMTGTNFSTWYNATEGTLFAQYSAVASGIRTINALNDGTSNESIRLRTNATNPLFTVTDGGVDQADIDAGTVASSIVYKFAGAYAANNFAASIAGGAAVTDTSGTLPTVDRATLGNSAASNYLNGHLRQIVYYPRRLANSELQAITA